jgi:long-subunit acyl-CoA synthetase (AMP-forming)
VHDLKVTAAEICGASREEPEAFFHHATSREINDAFRFRLSLAGAFWSGTGRIIRVRSLAGQYRFVFYKKLYTEDGEVTPTMKVKRKAIAGQYKDIIEEMYKGGK